MTGAGLLVPLACGAGRQSDAGVPPAPPAPPAPSAPPSPPREPEPETCSATEDNIEGPFFTPGAPGKVVLSEPGMKGTPLQVTGRILDLDCKPIAGARMQVWQCDADGAYDLQGFRLRGRLAADDDGGWHVRTIVPGHYLNGPKYRPAHIHVKLAAPGFRPLTTQLYFDGDPYNGDDPFIRDSLIMKLRRAPGGGGLMAARFDFVLPPA
ncbi:MAG TPA: hypothetical protein VL172_09210 [Kofleriaceae bacterium]|nr:hypothetical protein [Kofleriaceae bacterium]